LASLLGCAMAFGSDSGRLALEAAIHRWNSAVNARDLATLEATMTGDVQLSDGTSTVTGQDAAMRALREVATCGRLVASTREITIANDIGWHVVALTQIQENGDVRVLGQALEIWMRVNGEWKLHRRMMSSFGDPGDLLKRPPPDEPVLDRAPQ
jgi:ketosteroid isomerase-like protein